MQDRIPHNSESLKARFPEVYREFFSKCAFVCSAPRSVALVGEYIGYEALGMRQTLPMRTYVGLIPHRAKGFGVVQYVTFDPEGGKFREHILEDDLKNHIEDTIAPLLHIMFPKLAPQGFDVFILSELPLERALGGAGSLIVALTIAWLLVHQIITKEHIASWGKATIAELIVNPETKFDFTVRTIWTVEIALYHTASAISHFISLVPSAVPVIFTCKKNLDAEEVMRRVRNNEAVDFSQLISQSQYWAARSNELFGKHVGWPFPFDWGMVSTGQFRMVHEAIFNAADAQEELHEAAREAEKIKDQLLGKSFTGELPAFFKLCLPARSAELWQYYIGFLLLLSFQALLKLKRVLEEGSSRKYISELFELLNKIHSTFYPLGLCPDKINAFVHLLRQRIADKIGSDAVAVKMNSTARRGNILFATVTPLARPFMEDLLESIKNEAGEQVSLDYASWIDGYDEEGGVKIEQWLEKGIYSPLLAVDAVQHLVWSKKGEQKVETAARGAALKKKPDLLFDCITRQVCVSGKECTSKELPSQKATVAIMVALLTAEGHRLHNRALPESGYTKYRNEFQGKIVGPLTALVKKRLKKDLDLKVEGTLTDFWVSLDPKGLEMAVVKKLS